MRTDITPGVGSEESDARGPIRLLLVEDNQGWRETLEARIGMMGGFALSSTDSTREALKILRKAKKQGRSFEAVVSDLGLADNHRGGFVIADAVRAEGLASHFTLFTGSAGIVVTPEVMQAHGIDLLAPKGGNFRPQEVFEQVRDSILKPTPVSAVS